jgi:large subunit ribosomal protein L29
MKKEKLNVAEFSLEELNAKIASENAAVTKMKLNHAISPMENPMVIRETRKVVARLKTELTKRKNQN